jgi:hypothetical protein
MPLPMKPLKKTSKSLYPEKHQARPAKCSGGLFVPFNLMQSREIMTPAFLRDLNHNAAPAHRWRIVQTASSV